ncbi:MAG TPA: hypothetical protein VGL02_17745 [Streptomyces sp.]
MRIIIGLVVFIALWTLFAIGYRVTPPPDPAPPAPVTGTCIPTSDTTGPTTTAAPATGGGSGLAAHPGRGWPCPAVTSTLTVTAVSADR